MTTVSTLFAWALIVFLPVPPGEYLPGKIIARFESESDCRQLAREITNVTQRKADCYRVTELPRRP